MLELLEGKLSQAVLRGLGGSNPARLPGAGWVTIGSTRQREGIVKLLGLMLSSDSRRRILGSMLTARRLGRPLCPRDFGPTLETVVHLFAVRCRRQ